MMLVVTRQDREITQLYYHLLPFSLILLLSSIFYFDHHHQSVYSVYHQLTFKMTSNEMQVDVDPSSDQEEEEEEQTITGGLTIDDLEVSAPRIQSAPSAMLEQRKRMRAAAVPTDDAQVRKMLREMAHPITLFSERQPERRERLKFQIALKMGRVTVDGEKIVGVDGEDGEGDESEDPEGEEDGEHEEEGEVSRCQSNRCNRIEQASVFHRALSLLRLYNLID